MISGTTAWARFAVDVDITLVSAIIFTYTTANGANKILLQKRYPDDTEYRDSMIWLPLSQADTVSLRSGGGRYLLELQINFKSGAVGKSKIFQLCVADTLFTEFVDGSKPDTSNPTGNVIDVAVDDVVVVGAGGGTGGGYNIGHGLKLDVPTNTLSVNMTDKIEADNTLPISAAAVHETVGNIEAILSII